MGQPARLSEAEPAFDWSAVSLTPVEAADGATLNRWQNDPAIRDLIMGFRGPVPIETTAAWIEAARDQNLTARALFAIRQHGALKGVVQIHSIDWMHRTGILGLYIGDPAERGAGLGFAASTLMIDYGFYGLDLQRVWLEVIAPNVAAQRLYERLGFIREGTLRQAYQLDGVRHDIVLYGLMKPEWRSRAPAGANRLVQGL